MKRGLVLLGIVAATAVLLLTPALGGAQVPIALPTGTLPQVPDVNAPPADPRSSTPIVLHGADLGSWSVPSNVTFKLPLTDILTCPQPSSRDNCMHNHYATPDVDTKDALGQGTPTDRFLGYRWDARRQRFVQIPFQVDKVFTRYLDNSASGFAAYSGEDQHTTYQFDREGWRYTGSDPNDPCKAVPPDGVKTTQDPISGLDNNDELSFMASDSGPQAPSGTPAPQGIDGVKEVKVADPNNPNAPPGYVYIAKAAANGPKPAFNAQNGYVRYQRDNPTADLYEKSESSYSDYGNAAVGQYCDASGHVIGTGRRRPRDYATVTTPRYRFRYDGRWLMTQIGISKNDDWSYGPDLVDRWKARAFQQDPSSKTPCCGFEEEDTHWGGSSTLLGERSGPVRTIRETWGADSGTNVIRRETFYRDSMSMKSYLRVHPIPPLDGIYAQWDMAAGQMTRYANTQRPNGVPVDGSNDEVFGNLDDPCNDNYNGNDTSQLDQGYRSLYGQSQLCQLSPYHQSVDVFDPTFSAPNTALEWSETSGPNGTLVSHYRTKPEDLSPGGLVQSVVAVPYYRDDSCFDDGTGTDPGVRVKPGDANEPRTTATGAPRTCWHPQDGIPPAGTDRFFQGDIGTQGVHLLFIADSDNARQTVPVDQIVSEQVMEMLPGDQSAGGAGSTVGQAYGQQFTNPLTASVGRAAVRVRDAVAPKARLRATRDRSRHRIRLRWSGTDRGGSGVERYTLQVRRGARGRWSALLPATHMRSYSFKARGNGAYAFRLRAVDGAGNVGAWATQKVPRAR